MSREVARNGGRTAYRAAAAEARALERARRPKACKLAASARLRAVVAAKLAADWSPEQVSGWLKEAYPGNEGMRVSHEAIYQTLFVQARWALKRELTQHLRSRRSVRKPPAVPQVSAEGFHGIRGRRSKAQRSEKCLR